MLLFKVEFITYLIRGNKLSTELMIDPVILCHEMDCSSITLFQKSEREEGVTDRLKTKLDFTINSARQRSLLQNVLETYGIFSFKSIKITNFPDYGLRLHLCTSTNIEYIFNVQLNT